MTVVQRLAALCAAACAFSAMASPPPVRDVTMPDEPFLEGSPEVQVTSRDEKKIADCTVVIESGDGFERITEANGKVHTLRFASDGRLAEYDIGTNQFIIVYGDGRAIGFVNKAAGTAYPIKPGPGKGYIAALVAQGRLPTAEKIVMQVCGKRQKWSSSEFYAMNPDDYLLLESESYWDNEWDYGFDFVDDDWWATFAPTGSNCDKRAICLEGCDNNYLEMLGIAAVAVGFFDTIGMPYVAVPAGVAGIALALIKKSRCIDRCNSNYPC